MRFISGSRFFSYICETGPTRVPAFRSLLAKELKWCLEGEQSPGGPCFSGLSCLAAVTGIVTHEIKENALNVLYFLRCFVKQGGQKKRNSTSGRQPCYR